MKNFTSEVLRKIYAANGGARLSPDSENKGGLNVGETAKVSASFFEIETNERDLNKFELPIGK